MGFDATLDEIRFNIHEKRFETVLKLTEDMIHKYEEMDMYADDSVSEYFCFKESMEEILYCNYNKSEKDVRRAPVDYAEMYLLYGSILIDSQRI
ncbi:MAG: hypothetical protein E7207_07695 [Clostridium butyricum]|nr:hypothetical protein [Clostridium butyricum]